VRLSSLEPTGLSVSRLALAAATFTADDWDMASRYKVDAALADSLVGPAVLCGRGVGAGASSTRMTTSTSDGSRDDVRNVMFGLVGVAAVVWIYLFTGGLMIPVWIAAATLLALAERILPNGDRVARFGGAGLAGINRDWFLLPNFRKPR
jgi:hypothetical protein